MNSRKQMKVLAWLLGVYALLVATSYLYFYDQITAGLPGAGEQQLPASLWQVALVTAAGVFVAYGLAGLAGNWFARNLDLPGIYRPWAGWSGWIGRPMLAGLLVGVAMVALDRIFAILGSWSGFPHPEFPYSIIASASAGIGEEIMFRSFVLGFWAFMANLFLWRWVGIRGVLWIGNAMAALAFAAAHLPAAMVLLNVASPAELPPVVLLELLALNGLVGLVAGERYTKDGLVAAVGVHFWADIVWHVAWPVLGG